MSKYILALDQGTTSSRAILFGRDGCPVAASQQEFPQILPKPGEVEHDPEAIWSTQLETAREAMRKGNVSAGDVAAIGVTNQRETTLIWERASGKPVANAIVWQSRVSAPICDQLRADGADEMVREKTGLVIDAYFSGSKIKHLLDSIPGLRERARRGEVLFGTVDSFLIWRLTGGRCHVIDVSNASRTMLLNIHSQSWDDELLALLDVPREMLPEIVSSSGVVGETDEGHFGGKIPISGVAGDQQAAAFGQACFEKGAVKNTYGTGCFMLMNTGDAPVASANRLLTTIAWRIGDQTTYCLEGSVFIAGAVVQWLRDGLGIISESSEIEKLAASVPDAGGVVLVPAMVGLGAPHWDAYARGAIFGITRGTTAAHIARAAVESMAWQSRDLVDAMQADAGAPLAELKVDGGASLNDPLLQFQADVTGAIVRRPQVSETTALGAAYLAGLAVGYWTDQSDIEKNWALDAEFYPIMSAEDRQAGYRQWSRGVERTLGWAKP